MRIPVIHDCTKNTKRRNTGLSLQFIFPKVEVFFLRGLGLLGEQEAVALLEGHTVTGVLVIGGEASGVAVKRLAAGIFVGLYR